MAGRMGNKFVALCSVAVGAIYVTGYVMTDASHGVLAQSNSAILGSNTASTAQSNSSGSQSNTAGAQTGSASNQASNHTTSTSSAANSSTNATSSGTGTTTKKASSTAKQPMYLDGTYQGSGNNQIGSISVSLTIAHGKIASVNVTQCNTHYPCSYIDPVLPQEVVARQTYQVSIVSGATLSTYDFAYAVYQALGQAKNPKYKG